jgi:hypothetical protein
MSRRLIPAIVIALLIGGALLVAGGLASIRPTSSASPFDNAMIRLGNQ